MKMAANESRPRRTPSSETVSLQPSWRTSDARQMLLTERAAKAPAADADCETHTAGVTLRSKDASAADFDLASP